MEKVAAQPIAELTGRSIPIPPPEPEINPDIADDSPPLGKLSRATPNKWLWLHGKPPDLYSSLQQVPR